MHQDMPNSSWFVQARADMVQHQLRDRGVADERVLAAMHHVPREHFVADEFATLAYRDGALKIGSGQTISQPWIVATMCSEISPKPTDHVLEVGTGSGYGAAILAQVTCRVDTVERIPALASDAEQRFRDLKYDNIQVHIADGSIGLPERAPFDSIVVTAAAPALPRPYASQLRDGGHIVIPIGRDRTRQSLYRFTRRGDELTVRDLGGCAFVPLVGTHGIYHETIDNEF